jgi:hypothetical protein
VRTSVDPAPAEHGDRVPGVRRARHLDGVVRFGESSKGRQVVAVRVLSGAGFDSAAAIRPTIGRCARFRMGSLTTTAVRAASRMRASNASAPAPNW